MQSEHNNSVAAFMMYQFTNAKKLLPEIVITELKAK
jgi:hypothetical protein